MRDFLKCHIINIHLLLSNSMRDYYLYFCIFHWLTFMVLYMIPRYFAEFSYLFFCLIKESAFWVILEILFIVLDDNESCFFNNCSMRFSIFSLAGMLIDFVFIWFFLLLAIFYIILLLIDSLIFRSCFYLFP